MKYRKLSVTVEVYASKTHCGECSFQHSECDRCILFGEVLRRDEHGNRRLEDCAKNEWRARKGARAFCAAYGPVTGEGGQVVRCTEPAGHETPHRCEGRADGVECTWTDGGEFEAARPR